MISRSSIFLDRTTDGGLTDDRRARVLVALCERRFSFQDIAMALNCSESLVRSLLARPFRSYYGRDENGTVRTIEPIALRMLPRKKPEVISSNSASMPQDCVARLREWRASHLAIEVRAWLDTFEASDRDRQQTVEEAGFVLDGSPLRADGQCEFDIDRTYMEIVGIWRPFYLSPGDREFRKVVGPWLASWISFWITDPVVWDRALDLDYAHFGAMAQAA